MSTPSPGDEGATRRGTGSRRPGPSRLGVVAILGAALALRGALFVGYANVGPWDDTLYLRLAAAVREGRDPLGEAAAQLGALRRPELAFAARSGAYLPIAAAQAVLGANEIAAALPSLLASLGTIALSMWIGRRLVGPEAARWAGLALAVAPLDLVLATRILADAPALFWVTASVAAAIAAREARAGRGRGGWLVASGLCIFAGIATRPAAALVLPLAVAAARRGDGAGRGASGKAVLLVAAVPAALVLGRGAVCELRYGRFALPFALEAEAQRRIGAGQPEALYRPLPWLVVHHAYLYGPLHRSFRSLVGPSTEYPGVDLFSSWVPLGLVAALVGLARRRLVGAGLWAFAVFLYGQYGFRSLAWDGREGVLHYSLLSGEPRYVAMALPALAVALGWVIAAARRRSRLAAAALLLVLAGPSLVRAYGNWRFYRGSLSDLRAAAAFLAERAPARVLVDAWGAEQLALFAAEAAIETRVVSVTAPPEPGRAGEWIVLGGSRGFDLASEQVAALLPEPYRSVFLDEAPPPTGWRLELAVPGPHHVARRTDLRIFHLK